MRGKQTKAVVARKSAKCHSQNPSFTRFRGVLAEKATMAILNSGIFLLRSQVKETMSVLRDQDSVVLQIVYIDETGASDK